MLLESCLLIAFLNTADPSGTTIYPSGIKDNGDYVFSAPPAAVYPLLNIPFPIILDNDETILAGVYAVKPSKDEKILQFIDGDKIYKEFPICENIIVSDYCHTPIVKMEQIKDEVIFTYRIENISKKAKVKVKQVY